MHPICGPFILFGTYVDRCVCPAHAVMRQAHPDISAMSLFLPCCHGTGVGLAPHRSCESHILLCMLQLSFSLSKASFWDNKRNGHPTLRGAAAPAQPKLPGALCVLAPKVPVFSRPLTSARPYPPPEHWPSLSLAMMLLLKAALGKSPTGPPQGSPGPFLALAHVAGLPQGWAGSALPW